MDTYKQRQKAKESQPLPMSGSSSMVMPWDLRCFLIQASRCTLGPQRLPSLCMCWICVTNRISSFSLHSGLHSGGGITLHIPYFSTWARTDSMYISGSWNSLVEGVRMGISPSIPHPDLLLPFSCFPIESCGLCKDSAWEVERFSQEAFSVLPCACFPGVLFPAVALFGLFLSKLFSGTSFLRCPFSKGFSTAAFLLAASAKLMAPFILLVGDCILSMWFVSSSLLFELRSPSLNCLPTSLVHVFWFNLPLTFTPLTAVLLDLDAPRDSTCLRVFALLLSIFPEIVWLTGELGLWWFSLVSLTSSFLALVYVTVPFVTVAVYFTVLDGEGLTSLIFLALAAFALWDDIRVTPLTLETWNATSVVGGAQGRKHKTEKKINNVTTHSPFPICWTTIFYSPDFWSRHTIFI